MLLSSVNFSGFTVNAALPTTDGHDKYVNKAAFDVIGSKDFGSKDLDGPLFDKTKGSQNITELQVPTLAYDDTSVGLVWQKPENMIMLRTTRFGLIIHMQERQERILR